MTTVGHQILPNVWALEENTRPEPNAAVKAVRFRLEVHQIISDGSTLGRETAYDRCTHCALAR